MGETEQKLLFHIDPRDPRKNLFGVVARDLGVKVLQFSFGQEALTALEKQIPDILITSLHYPNEDLTGKDVAEAARKKGVIHVVITTNAEVEKVDGVEVLDIPRAVDRLADIVHGGSE